jgi:hypothetical protein
VQVQISAAARREQQRAIQTWGEGLQGLMRPPTQRDGPRNARPRLPVTTDVTVDVDTSHVQDLVRLVDVAAFQGQPFLGPQPDGGDDDRQPRAQLGGDGLDFGP